MTMVAGNMPTTMPFIPPRPMRAHYEMEYRKHCVHETLWDTTRLIMFHCLAHMFFCLLTCSALE